MSAVEHPIVLLVFGGRAYRHRYALWNRIHEIIDGVPFNKVTVRHGACPTGADYHAHLFCEQWTHYGLIEDPHPAKWHYLTAPGAIIRDLGDGTLYNARAGLDRNEEMVICHPLPTHALGAPGGTGTAHMRRCIERAIADGVYINLQMLDR